MCASYSVLAKYYDTFTQNDCDYESWSQYLYSIARGANVEKIVDVACGTGKMTALLAAKGFDVLGVDASEQMLSQAVSKCRKARFVRQDMRKLALTRPADMAVCVNDGINYLKQDELPAFFLRVADNLRGGAPFVFDISSAYKLREVLSDNVFYLDGENETLLWTNEQRDLSAVMSLTLFERKPDSSYVRNDEVHTQYVHEVEDVKNALVSAGFSVAEISAEYGKLLEPNSQRITFHAIKNVLPR